MKKLALLLLMACLCCCALPKRADASITTKKILVNYDATTDYSLLDKKKTMGQQNTIKLDYLEGKVIFMQFDLSGIQNAENIVSANLHLYCESMDDGLFSNDDDLFLSFVPENNWNDASINGKNKPRSILEIRDDKDSWNGKSGDELSNYYVDYISYNKHHGPDQLNNYWHTFDLFDDEERIPALESLMIDTAQGNFNGDTALSLKLEDHIQFGNDPHESIFRSREYGGLGDNTFTPYLEICYESSVLPEPATMSLLGIGGLLLGRRKRG